MKLPLIFHITHADNLPAIIRAGGLSSDRRMAAGAGPNVMIGYQKIKLRRLNECRVPCHPGTTVGDYVPFYFCPRSVMLYVIWRGNTDLEYRGGQREVVHLVSDVNRAVATGRRIAFSDCNASASYAAFSADLDRLKEFVDWTAVKATQWADPAVKDKKQAEFLVHDFYPWTGIHHIGVYDRKVLEKVGRMVKDAAHKPEVSVRGGWYY